MPAMKKRYYFKYIDIKKLNGYYEQLFSNNLTIYVNRWILRKVQLTKTNTRKIRKPGVFFSIYMLYVTTKKSKIN